MEMEKVVASVARGLVVQGVTICATVNLGPMVQMIVQTRSRHVCASLAARGFLPLTPPARFAMDVIKFN